MRIIVADCEVLYEGRGLTTLARARRAIIIKSDGAISVHQDKSNKPLNYMGAGSILTIERKGRKQIWVFASKKESITVTIHKIVDDHDYELEAYDEGLVRQKTEDELQAWLAKHPEAVGRGYKFIAREFRTPVGPVDLLMQDEMGNYIVVEVKRKAMIDSVYQVKRYVDSLNLHGELGEVRGIVVSPDVRPNTLRLAEQQNIQCVELVSV